MPGSPPALRSSPLSVLYKDWTWEHYRKLNQTFWCPSHRRGYGGTYRCSEWAAPLIWGGNSPNPGLSAVHVAGRPPNSASTDFGHWIPHAPTLLDTLTKRKLKWCQHMAGRPRRWGQPAPLWLGWAQALCHVIPSCHIICDYALFWTYW
jgi:hypothetical protein